MDYHYRDMTIHKPHQSSVTTKLVPAVDNSDKTEQWPSVVGVPAALYFYISLRFILFHL